jgi:predicted nucleic acid-binding protein
MRVYLDVSCLDRPFDDQWQERIRLETEAVALIFDRFESGVWRHVSSQMVIIEIAAMPDADRRQRVRNLLPAAEDIMSLSLPVLRRAETLVGLGFRAADAVHIASAEAHRADALLSCDDKLVRRGGRLRRRLAVEVDNRLSWVRRQDDAENT